MIDNSFTVVRLYVNVESHLTVYFREGKEQGTVNRYRPGTELAEWFEAKKK